MATHDVLRQRVGSYYEGRLREHGATPRGVDWNSTESQELRFRQLEQLWRDHREASILDYGCGYGAMAGWLRRTGHTGSYLGFDVSAEMIRQASMEGTALPDCRFTCAPSELTAADYAVASGVFNVKLDTPDSEWHDYVLATIADLAARGRRGFGFNVLTLYSDPDKRRADLYYADPLELFSHCRLTYSRFVTLLHDYPLYEFTLLVRH